MISKINSIPKYTAQPANTQAQIKYNPEFCANINYPKTPNKKNLFTGIKTLFTSVKKFFADIKRIPEESPFEIENNNKFIASIQGKISKRLLPLGEFENKDGYTVTRIKNAAGGNKTLEILSKDNNSLIRFAVVDKNNTILEYNTAYPWRKFVKTNAGYKSAVNVDEYMKQYISDPQYSMEFIPKF